LYQQCSDQWIVGPSGAVALNLLAVEQTMKYLKVPKDERLLFSMKARQIGQYVLKFQQDAAEAKRKNQQ